jgi:Protein of unknown function (DUF3309)
MSTILLIILILLLIGALPAWPYSRGWGYYPSGGLGLILVIIIILVLLRAIWTGPDLRKPIGIARSSLIFNDKGVTRGAVIRFRGMKKYICMLTSLALLVACEQRETTVTNPPAEKKESNTTVVNPPAQKKESNTTVVNPPEQKKETTVVNPTTETKKEKTEVNINTSPNP